MSKIRTFVAVEISPEVRRRAADWIERFRSQETSFKWVDPPNLHFTLCFLGEVDDRALNDVCTSVAQGASKVSPFQLTCGGVGAFPEIDRPHTIWLGVQHGSEEMSVLQSKIENELAGLGFPRERRKFHPHLTLGRLRHGHQAASVSQLLDSHTDYEAASMSLDEVVVFSSHLEKQGPVYEALSRASLGSS